MRHQSIILAIAAAAVTTAPAFAASSRASRTEPAAMRADSRPAAPVADANSVLAKRQAEIAQGFAPIDTENLTRGFTR